MSSPFRRSDHSPSSQRSTPSRPYTNGVRRANGYHRSYHDTTPVSSPSRQLLEEFSRMLINDERAFRQSLDEQSAAQQKLHLEALDRALAKHEEVRESAERTRERVELELEKERRRQIEEEHRAVEKARRDLEEQRIAQERRRLEELKAQEEEKKKAEELKREQDAVRERQEKAKQEQDETKRRAELRQKEEELKKAQQPKPLPNGTTPASVPAASSPAPAPPSTAVPQTSQPAPVAKPTPPAPQPAAASAQAVQPDSNLPDGLVSSMQEREAIHRQYLDLHKRLKQMREQVTEQAKQVPGLKNQLSDWRRAIKKCCGQLSKGDTAEVKAGNKRSMVEIVQHLDAAASISEPSIDVTQYLVENKQPPGANKQGPACLLFLLNHFAKNVVKQFISESAVDAKSADPIGVLAVTVFARPQYLFNGQSLIDLLWAKYHVHCPILFGIYGSEKTKGGRLRLGWKFDADAGAFVSEQEHYDRMSGLGVGFASITLRDFSKSKNANPAPNRIYWQSFARILNTPANETQATHFVILKAMIDQYVPRIIGTFGGAGIALLRRALIDFPNEKGPQDDKGRKLPAVTAVQAMPTVLQRDLSLSL